MAGQRWMVLVVAAGFLAPTGCLNCSHHGYDIARHSGPECEVPSCQRNAVYVFAMSSLNPVSIVALDDLREQLNRQGFSKVATGQTIHAGWMAREMNRIHEEEPEAAFVIVGFESAAPVAARLAERSISEGMPVAGVVVITSGDSSSIVLPRIRTLAIGSAIESGIVESVEAVPVPNVASYGLATDSRTVEAIGRMLRDAAVSIPMPEIAEPSAWSYPFAPPMRPEGNSARDPNWVFMFDQGARAVRAPAQPTSAAVAQPANPVQHGLNR